MSHYDYLIGRNLDAEDYPFYAFIQAAMRKADSDNLDKLTNAFPLVWSELQARYKAPGGHLPGDK